MIYQAPVAPAGPQTIDRYFQKLELIIRHQNIEALKTVLNNPHNEVNLKEFGFYLLELAEHYKVSHEVLDCLKTHPYVVESITQSTVFKQALLQELKSVLPDWQNPIETYENQDSKMNEEELITFRLRPR